MKTRCFKQLSTDEKYILLDALECYEDSLELDNFGGSQLEFNHHKKEIKILRSKLDGLMANV